MDVKQKTVWTGYFLSWAVTAAVGFGIVSQPSLLTGYGLLMMVFLIPIIAILFLPSVSLQMRFITLFCSPLLAILLVLDPVEIGLYGHDPYMFSMVDLNELQSGNLGNMLESLAWPGMYSLALVVDHTTAAKTLTVAKYLPLLSSTIPLIYYIGIRRLTDEPIAFVSAMAFASLRSIYIFESKFVDEFLAIILFISILTVIFTIQNAKRKGVLLVLMILTISITHHATAIFLLLLLILWILTPHLLSRSFVPERFQPCKINSRHQTGIYAIIGILTVWLLLTGNPEYSGYLISLVQEAVTTGETARQSGGFAAPTPNIVALIARGAVIPIGIFCFLVAYRVISAERLSGRELGWSIFAGVVGIIYGISLVGGDIIPLYSGRMLIYWAPALIIVALPGVKYLFPQRETLKKVLLLCLLFSFVATQVTAIRPHAMYSDKSTTSMYEGHYTPAQFEASDWTSEYVTDNFIIGEERGLWNQSGTPFKYPYWSPDKCDVYVWRIESGESLPRNRSIVYSAGDIQLHTCTPSRSSSFNETS
ncbi:hypothetical protein [Haloferax volcanii]|uniref:hypothetical protein n=1 Tax=Haloferax volcanii TaxID=2246 RepID=UPI0038550392